MPWFLIRQVTHRKADVVSDMFLGLGCNLQSSCGTGPGYFRGHFSLWTGIMQLSGTPSGQGLKRYYLGAMRSLAALSLELCFV